MKLNLTPNAKNLVSPATGRRHVGLLALAIHAAITDSERPGGRPYSTQSRHTRYHLSQGLVYTEAGGHIELRTSDGRVPIADAIDIDHLTVLSRD